MMYTHENKSIFLFCFSTTAITFYWGVLNITQLPGPYNQIAHNCPHFLAPSGLYTVHGFNTAPTKI